MRLELTGEETQMLAAALQDAFTFNELRMMLRVETGMRIEDLVTMGSGGKVAFFEVVEGAEQRSRTSELLLGASAWRPDDTALAAYLTGRGVSSASEGRLSVPATLRGNASSPAALQRILGATAAWSDTEAFLGKLGQLESLVCRIELNDQALGSGFLVGPDLVLTNWHVMDAFRQAPGAVGCRFDYRRIGTTEAERSGVSFALASRDWLVASSPAAEGDDRLGGTPPTPNELDYALLRLAVAAGTTAKGQSRPGAAVPRGHIGLHAGAAIPARAAPVFLLQHPRGTPLKLAVGSVLEQVNPVRLRYDADSEAGSSGAPLFDARLELVGLHHATDPDGDPRHRPAYNQGIPIADIVGDLRDRVGLAPIWN